MIFAVVSTLYRLSENKRILSLMFKNDSLDMMQIMDIKYVTISIISIISSEFILLHNSRTL